MRFQTVIELGGKTATGFEVPADVVAALDSGKKPKVSVTIGGHRYRSTVAVYGGRFMLPLNAENRARAGVAAGEKVSVDVELDTKPREVSIPVDVQRLLEADPRQRLDSINCPTAGSANISPLSRRRRRRTRGSGASTRCSQACRRRDRETRVRHLHRAYQLRTRYHTRPAWPPVTARVHVTTGQRIDLLAQAVTIFTPDLFTSGQLVDAIQDWDGGDADAFLTHLTRLAADQAEETGQARPERLIAYRNYCRRFAYTPLLATAA